MQSISERFHTSYITKPFICVGIDDITVDKIIEKNIASLTLRAAKTNVSQIVEFDKLLLL